MPLLWVIVAILMMLVGGMLVAQNPEPTQFAVNLLGRRLTVEASIVELIGYSIAGGAVAMAVPYLRALYTGGRERRELEREARRLRESETALRRDTENARSETRLLEARLAEAEERCALLEAELRPLLTMKKQAEANGAAAAAPKLRRTARPATSRWRRR